MDLDNYESLLPYSKETVGAGSPPNIQKRTQRQQKHMSVSFNSIVQINSTHKLLSQISPNIIIWFLMILYKPFHHTFNDIGRGATSKPRSWRPSWFFVTASRCSRTVKTWTTDGIVKHRCFNTWDDCMVQVLDFDEMFLVMFPFLEMVELGNFQWWKIGLAITTSLIEVLTQFPWGHP